MSQRREPPCSLSTSCRLLVFLLLSLAMVANSRAAEALGQNVILLMIDGFANKFLNTTGPLNGFERMAEHGVQAEYLKPSFPSLSFPNWQSLATGLYVENHGFTGNFMYDPASDMKFLIGIGPNDTDQLWWNQSEPLWYIAGKGNVNVHCYWWGGCHVPHKDVVVQVPPPRVLNFSNEFQTDALANYFDDIVKMIRIYEPYRRQLVMAYFASVDIQGHYYGPSSPETVDQVRKANDLVNALQDKLEKADLFDSTNLIVLSDHGQIDLDRDEKYYIDECLSDHSKIVAVVDCYASMLVIAKPEYVDEVGSILISVDIGPIYFELNTCDQWAQNEYEDDEGAAPPVKAYRVNKLPERFHFKNARFLPAIVLLARPGASVLTRELPSVPPLENMATEFSGMHGYDNEHPDMHGIFFARGPAFKQNYKSRYVNMVDIYQVILSILDLKTPHEHNGTWANVEDMLASGIEAPPPSEIGRSKSPNSANSLLFSLATLILASLTAIVRQRQ